MSQRGKLRNGAQKRTSATWRTYILNPFVIALAVTLGSTLTVLAQEQQTSKVVTLLADGRVSQVTTSKETVQTLLHQEHLMLKDLDRCEPPINTPLVNGMVIAVTRVECKRFNRDTQIPFTTETRLDPRLYVSQSFELQSGRNGIKREKVVVWKRDGVVSAQWVDATKVIRRSRPLVMLQGSAPATSRGGFNVRRLLTMESTAYDPGPLSCGKNCTGRTATGMKAQKGIVAVDPRVIPLGTRVYVEGYGPAIAADTGGAIKGNRIDVCFESRGEALRWGRRNVRVMILQ